MTCDVIVTTLAVGPKYAQMGANLMRELAAAGNTTLVLTDAPDLFTKDTIVIPYAPDGSHIWHSKRHVLRAGLDRAQVVYFIDADYCRRDTTEAAVPLLPALPAGLEMVGPTVPLGTIRFRGIGTLDELQNPTCLGLLDAIQADLGLSSWRELPWCGDELYAISKDTAGGWQKLLAAWDRFATYQPAELCAHDARRAMVGGDGTTLAFVAAAAGWSPRSDSRTLLAIRRAFRHERIGAWKFELTRHAPK